MVQFIFSIIFTALAVLAFVALSKLKITHSDGGTTTAAPGIKVAASAVLGVIALALFIPTIVTTVTTKNVGVVTVFNRPTGEHLSNGLHFKLPWEKTTELDGAIQIDTRSDKDKNPITVRLGNDSTANVEGSIQWRIKPDAADQLFLNYRTFDNIETNLVSRQLETAFNDVLATYNPIASVQGTGQVETNESLARKVRELLTERVGEQVEIQSILIKIIHFDQNTQDKINAFQGEIGNTRIAEQKQDTATAEAEANRIISGSVNNDPNVLVSKCLDIVKQSGQSPLGCWNNAVAVPTVPAK